MKSIKNYIVVSVFSLFIFFLINNSIFSVGKIINMFYLCKQDLMSPFPCYAGYDMFLMLALLVIFITSLILMVLRLIKRRM